MEERKWRKSLVDQLQQRNKLETACFQDLIALHNRLFENTNVLKNENLQLSIQNEKLRSSVHDSKPSSGPPGANNEKIQALEHRLLVQQEELTSLHRRRSENSQQIITLTSKLHDAEKQLSIKDTSLSESCAINASLRADIQSYETNMQVLQKLNEALRDEYQALQITFNSLEEKLRKAQDENQQLLDKLLKYKAKDINKYNDENESFIKRRQDTIKKDLEEAAKESGRASPGSTGSGGSPCAGGSRRFSIEYRQTEGMFYSNSLPTKMLLKFEAHDGDVNAVRWSPTDRLVATGGADRKVKLWDVSKGACEQRGTLVGSNAAIMSIDFDSAGAMVLAASNDFASRVWTVADQRLRHTLTGHSGKVMAGKFLGEPSKVITGSYDRTLKIWDLRSKACIETKFAGSSCNDLVTSDSSGSTIISGHFDQKIRFWDIRSDAKANELPLQGKITSLDLSKDCNYLLACVRDDTIKLLDLRMNNIVRSFCHDTFKVGCDWTRACFSPDGQRLAVGSSDGGVFIWATQTGRLETTLKDHTSAVTAVAWHLHSGCVASVDRSKKVVIWGDM